ncbi:MAG TPA: hypothetical protein VGW80_00980 [Solirubrobacterales bacterium]|nr:hypothetical protein [Solirubrobacterales bacterium]
MTEQHAVIESFRSRAGLLFSAAAITTSIVAIYIESEHPAAIDSLHRELIHHMHASYLQNREGLNLLAVLLQLASGLLVFEIALWIVAIAIKS